MIQTRNFSQSELEYSYTANRFGIDNRIPAEYLQNAQDLLNALQIIRDVLGKPIKITSGYRCPRLNQIVGGVSNSSHMKAWAADIQVEGMSAKNLYYWLAGFLIGRGMKFGQLIYEKSANKAWVHFSIRDDSGQRCQIKELNV